jgi:NADPH-dependent 2,4-dienoyl-CoA reductase/sulfur reductase-like enzyme
VSRVDPPVLDGELACPRLIRASGTPAVLSSFGLMTGLQDQPCTRDEKHAGRARATVKTARIELKTDWSTSMANSNCDRRDVSPLMVVGAGPTGLAAAMNLARFGGPCRIIDRLPEPQAHPRAVAVQPRTLELFDL